MKVLMFHGRAGGHNILPFLEYFNASSEHQLTFIYSNDRTYYPDKDRIEYHKFSFNPVKIARLSKIIGKEYDLIWYHGGHSAMILFIFSLLRNKKSTFIFNVWNEWLIQKAKKGGLKGRMFQFGIRHADVIHCNWHGTAQVLADTGWHKTIRVFYWGLQKENFTDHHTPESKETKEFIAQLPANKVKFFFPKSISPNSRHDLVIEAASILISKGVTNFITYLWLGNSNDEELLEKYNLLIKKLKLEEHVILKKHGFLSFGDMQLIWKQMDAGLQIAANEQLSTTFLEPQFYKKEIVVTDILPYRIYNEKFNVHIPLIPLTNEAVASSMESIIEGNFTPMDEINRRSKIVRDNFNFSSNIEEIIRYYNNA